MTQYLLLDRIKENYDLNIEKWDHYQGSYKLYTNRGIKLVKVWNDDETLSSAFHLREQLAYSGFRTIDRFIRTTSGEPYILNGDEYLVITDWIDGRIPQVTNENDLKRLGKQIAKLHLSLEKIHTDQDFEPWSIQFDRGLQHLRQIKDKITAKSKKNSFDETVLSYLDSHLQQVVQSILMANQVEKISFHSGRQPQLCHGNLELKWFRIDTYQEPWLIHFGIPVYDIPAYDVAKFLVHLYLKAEYQEKSLFQFLEGYQEMMPLDKEEKLWILTYITFPHHLWKFLYMCYLSGLQQKRFIDEQQYFQLIDLQKQLEQLYRTLYQYFRL
ncbi:phosphotransferase [Tepidibacillus sp. LV47]|uniref:phosphotransferase n=1 Tax=Tepidibacillus sp. LV47 TaxID=3398228 RepID=UPI003AAF1ABC